MRPVRKIYYSITVTALSVVVALLIGGVQVVGLLSERLDITTGVVGWIAAFLDDVGFVIVGLFAATWAVAVAVWHFGRIEERLGGRGAGGFCVPGARGGGEIDGAAGE